MKILFITLRLPHAMAIGGHGIVRRRILGLVRRGHQVGLAAFARPGDAEHREELAPHLLETELVPPPHGSGIERYRLGHPFLIHPHPFSHYRSNEMARRIGDMVERTRYDIAIAEFSVMGQYLDRNPWLPAVRRILSVHHCYTVMTRKAARYHGWLVRTFVESLVLQRLQRYEFDLYRRADRVLTLTAEERFQMAKIAPDLAVQVIPSGVDTNAFAPGNAGDKEPALVFTGRYSDEPNRDAFHWFLAEVWPRLRSRHPALRFYAVGPDPSPQMLEAARRDERLVVTGEVDDVLEYLRRARIFVCPVRLGSGMRGKLLEAMAAGVPVVSTTAGAEGIPIQIGETGFLADTPRILADTIEMLLADPALQARVADKARQMVDHRFSWDNTVTALERVFEDAISSR